jgi:hypothetical protein
MTRRSPITSTEQADKELESLGWLRGAASPNREVRRLFDVAVHYRTELHRLRDGGEQKRPGFVERVEQNRK